MSKAGFHIPSLDGLRAISFGMVFIAHAGLDGLVPGGFGVTVFFFLSGFLITTLMRTELEKSGTVSLPHFYLRRALRILPPFYIVLFTATLLTAMSVLDGQLLQGPVVAQALHYANYWIVEHGYKGFAPGTGVYWSLAVEEHFYLLFPLFYLALQRWSMTRGRQALVLLALCGLALIWRCVLVYLLHSSIDRTSVASDARFDSILFGCALAVYGNPMLDESSMSEVVWKYVLFPLGLFGLMVSFAIRNPAFRETVRYSMQGAALVPVFVCAMRYPRWIIMRPLNWKPIAYLGVLSYSLYLMHQVVIFGVLGQMGVSALGTLPLVVVAFSITLALSFVMYQVVEKPCAKLRRRFSGQTAPKVWLA